MNKPNVLFIHCHDLGTFLGCYGHPVSTPRIDEFAAHGVLFENHFATATICSPSRGSLWTGHYPHSNGLMGLMPRGWALDTTRCQHLSATFKNAGYETHLFGVQHEHWDPFAIGYQSVHTKAEDTAEHISTAFRSWLKNREPSSRPFLASVGFFEPHRFGLASQGLKPELLQQEPSHFRSPRYSSADPSIVKIPPHLPDSDAQRQELADFYGAVQYMDAHTGTILDSVRDAGCQNNTIVVFTSDHGASFLHSKGTLYDGGTKVPLIVRWPDVLPEGNRIRALTSHVDVFSTLCEWVGIECQSGTEGFSFTSLTDSHSQHVREFVFAERNYTQYFDPARMIRSKHHKYIRNGIRKCVFDFVLTEIELGAVAFRNDLSVFRHYASQRVQEELYDLDKDPGELRNLAGDPTFAAIKNEMSNQLKEHFIRTADPFDSMHIPLLMPENTYSAVKRV